MCSPCLSFSSYQPLLPLTLLLLLHYQHTHPLTTEAVVLFDYIEEHDDELSLKMGDVVTNVEQVCESHNLYCSKLPYIEQHNGDGNLAMKMLHVTHHMMCCSVYSSMLAASLVPRLLCWGGGKRTWYTRMCKVPLVTCLLLKLKEIFCLPAERLHCKVILPVRHLRVVLRLLTISL